jgi:hypothetical protein
MIQAYPEIPTILSPGTLTLRVSTDAPSFHCAFYRQGASLEYVGDLGVVSYEGSFAPPHSPAEDWGTEGQDPNGNPVAPWTAYAMPIPPDWPSGVYIAILTQLDANGSPITVPDVSTADGRDAKALFVIRTTTVESAILYKLPLFTYHAYNQEGNPPQSLYTGATTVNIRRPGGGTGGTPWDTYKFPDYYDAYQAGRPQRGSPRQTFAHWDAPFVMWLERNGIAVDYCTDLDIHTDDGSLLARYGLLLTAGHDEYWSREMRIAVTQYLADGGNAAFFSGNVCWHRIEFVPAQSLSFANTGLWYQQNEPENTLTGVSYRNAGGQWDGARPRAVGYTVQNTDHWILRPTAAREGQVVGEHYGSDPANAAAVVGYECDGAAFDRPGTPGVPVVPNQSDMTPADFIILGVADVTGWQDYKDGNHAATMGVRAPEGTLFAAATTDWPRVLNHGGEPSIDCITRVVINSLRRLPTVPGLVSVAGFFSSDDNYRHAIVGSADGTVREIFYNPTAGTGETVIGTVPGLVSVAGFFSSDDNYRHAIVGSADGTVREIFYTPRHGVYKR